MFGTDRIDNISRHVREVTQSPETWRKFLDTVSRFPEFSFYENLVIHSKMAGAKLDAPDTAYHDKLYRRLSDKYAIPAFTLPRTLDGLAAELARNNLQEAYTEDLGIGFKDFAPLMRYSLCYVLSQKCGVEPNIPENAFDSITKLNTYPKLNALGTAVVELCKPIIKDIDEMSKEIHKEKGSEKMNEPKKDRLKEITDSLEQGIKDLFSSGKYAEYLRTMSNFHSYSYNNILLIHSQKPNATLVAGFNKWKDKFSRHVKKGEKGIQIIAPVIFKRKIEEVKTDPDTGAPILDRDGNAVIVEKEVQAARFKVVSVFDVSQTDGKPLPQLADELKGDVKHFDEFVEALKRSSPVPVEFKPMQESMDGYFSNSEQKIAIREGMSEVQTVCALVHEIAHSKLHNTAILNEAEENPKNSRTQEVEAESISYAVCQYYNIETSENSFGYIATWSKDKELSELKSSLETISKTSNELINDIDRNFREICKERGIDLTKEEQTAEEPVNEETEQTAETESISETSSEDMATVEVKDEEPAEPIKEETEQTVETEPVPKAPIEEQSVAETEQTAEENIPAPSEVEETSEDLPDPTLTVKDMNDSGYLKEDMLPISKERAAEFMEQDITVYALHSDNTEEMLFDVSEIEEQSGNMFGIAKEDWEQVKESVHSHDNEKKFLSEDRDSFLIYQLKEDAPNELRFASLREIGCNPDKENYTAVYMGLTDRITDPIETLDKLYNDFNADRPKDFKGHSMSVSDVVALKKDGEVTFHFVDSIGFKELPDFAKDMVLDTPIKEESKLPTVAELKEQAMSGKPISLMDLAAAVQREDKPKSILSKLKAPAVRQDKPKAPKKGAEMEL